YPACILRIRFLLPSEITATLLFGREMFSPAHVVRIIAEPKAHNQHTTHICGYHSVMYVDYAPLVWRNESHICHNKSLHRATPLKNRFRDYSVSLSVRLSPFGNF